MELADRLANSLIERFWDEERDGFFASAEGDASLIVRLKDDYDGAEPSANSMAALALQKLGAILEDRRLSEYARRTIEAFRYQWTRAPRTMPLMLVAMMRELRPMQQIVVVMGDSEKEGKRLLEIASQKRSLHSAVIRLGKDSEWLQARNQRLGAFVIDGQAAAYVCDDFVCQEPAFDGESLERQLERD